MRREIKISVILGIVCLKYAMNRVENYLSAFEVVRR